MSIVVKTLVFVNQFSTFSLYLTMIDVWLGVFTSILVRITTMLIVVGPHCRTIVHFVINVPNLIH